MAPPGCTATIGCICLDEKHMLAITRHGAVLRLTLDRPERHNAFNEHLIAQLTQALEEAAADGQLRAVVLAGNGPSFSAGADVDWMARQAVASHQDNLRDARALARLMRTLDTLPVPTIAVVQGAAYGGGVGLAACCDIVIAADNARFALSEVRLGLLPAVISPYVVAAIGARQARRWFTTGQPFAAGRAQQMGLVHEVVAAQALEAAVEEQLQLLLQAAPHASRTARQLIADVVLRAADPAAQDHHNAALIANLRAGAEGREGLAAFLEKRAPQWVQPA
jgi:methylglutaconyl-CoA hydratase